jgi:alkylation response protein AidB-like acyl-CoA dehydrogenase
MRLRPDDDALAFAASVRDLLERSCDVEALRAAWDSPDGRVPGLWKRLADVGVTGLTVPERYGGAGADLTWALEVFTVAGEAVVPEPLVETLAAAEVLAAAGGAVADEWLPRVADGSAVLAMGPGASGPGAPGLVSAAGAADLLLLADDAGVWAMPAAAVAVEHLPSVDKGMRLATVTWSATDAVARIDSPPALAAYDWAVVATAAQLVGVGAAMLDMAVRYAQQREQFGRAIGSFQAIKHQLADVYVALSFARPVVRRAAWSVAQDLPTRARDASHAKHAASVAAGRAAKTALQVHGGIGYTFEHDLHMWLKRTWSLASLWGNAAHHRGRVARAVLEQGVVARVP